MEALPSEARHRAVSLLENVRKVSERLIMVEWVASRTDHLRLNASPRVGISSVTVLLGFCLKQVLKTVRVCVPLPLMQGTFDQDGGVLAFRIAKSLGAI